MKATSIAVCAAFMFSNPVFAQQGESQKGGKGSEPTPEQFQERKQEMLKGIDRRIQMLQQTKACLQKAQNREQARACRPEGGERGEMGKGHRGEKDEDH